MKKSLLIFISTLATGLSSLAQPTAEICLVTVDSTLTHNIVVWERANVVSTNPVDSIRIWRADVTGSYGKVGTVHFDSLSEFHDYTADPNLHSYYYAIQAVDDNGTAGPLSDVHGTIHFSVVDDGSGDLHLLWTPYVGHSVDNYVCWLDSLASNIYHIVNTTAGNDTDWTQTQTPLNWANLWYKVDVQWTLSCESTRASHNTTRSNKTQPASGQLNVLSKPGLSELMIFPNPTKESVNIKFSSLRWEQTAVNITDLNGRSVYKGSPVKVLGQYNLDVNTSEFAPGLYLVLISNGIETITEKLIVTE